MLQFRHWFENHTLFGFDADTYQDVRDEDFDLPIRPFSVQTLINRLSTEALGTLVPHSDFNSQIQWGQEPGALRVVVSPKYAIKIQRLHKDLLGEQVWLLKKYFQLDEEKWSGKESTIADEILSIARNVFSEGLESPTKPETDSRVNIESVATALATKIKQSPDGIFYLHGIKKKNENEFVVFCDVLGTGRGSRPISRGIAMLETIINLSYLEERGVIKAFVEVVASRAEGGGWDMQPADFEDYFFPSQGKMEIVTPIMTCLKYF